jgi:hypothetical protein
LVVPGASFKANHGLFHSIDRRKRLTVEKYSRKQQ